MVDAEGGCRNAGCRGAGNPGCSNPSDGRSLRRIMGGSTPEQGGANDYATLEEVFASRAFGHALPEVPARDVQPEALTAAKPYFVRNRFVAAAATAAAALSIVAGLNLGSGPTGSPQFAAKSTGSATSPDLGTPPAGTTPGPAGGSSGSSNAGGSGAGTASNGVAASSTGGTPAAEAVAAQTPTPARRLRAHSHPDRGRDGLLRPDRGRGRRDGALAEHHHDDHDDHDPDHGDDDHDHSGLVRFGWSAPGRWQWQGRRRAARRQGNGSARASGNGTGAGTGNTGDGHRHRHGERQRHGSRQRQRERRPRKCARLPAPPDLAEVSLNDRRERRWPDHGTRAHDARAPAGKHAEVGVVASRHERGQP